MNLVFLTFCVGNVDMSDLLLQNGAAIDPSNNNGSTPLMVAIEIGR